MYKKFSSVTSVTGLQSHLSHLPVYCVLKWEIMGEICRPNGPKDLTTGLLNRFSRSRATFTFIKKCCI